MSAPVAEVRRPALETGRVSGRRRLVRWLIVSLGVAGLVSLAAYLEEVTTPFLFGLLLAYILDPLVAAAERRGVRRTAAVLVLFGLVLILCASALVAGSVFVARGVEDLAHTLVGERLLDPEDEDDRARLAAAATAAMTDPTAPLVGTENGRPYLDLDRDGQRDPGPAERGVRAITQRLGTALGSGVRAQLEEVIRSSGASLLRAASSVGEGMKSSLKRVGLVLSYLLLVPLYTFFLLQSFPQLRDTVRDHLPGAYRGRIVDIAGQIDRQVAAFFRGKLMVAGLKGLVTGLGFLIVGVPFGPLIGLMAGVLSVVPLAGPVCSGGLALLLSLPSEQWAFQAGGVLVVLLVAEVVEGIAQPVILGHEVGLSPLTLILAIFAFGHLFGLLGVLLAVPFACVVKVLFLELLLPEIQALAQEPGPPLEAGAGPSTPAAPAAPAALASTAASSPAPALPAFGGPPARTPVDPGQGPR